jgi:hypothetical protein
MMGLSRLQSLQEDTRRRFDAEMRTVSGIVYRELAHAGLVNGPMPQAWHPEEAIGLLNPATQGELSAITGAMMDAGIEVDRVYRSLDGARERGIHALQVLADAIDYCVVVNTDVEVDTYLSNVANVGGVIGLNEEKKLDSRILRQLRAQLDLALLTKQAAVAEAIADHLVLRRPEAITPRTYGAKRAGPLSHLCWKLGQPLVAFDDQALVRDHFAAQGVELTAEEMCKPRLTLEEIAQRVDETYHRSGRLPHDLEDAADRVRQRVQNFQRSLNSAE